MKKIIVLMMLALIPMSIMAINANEIEDSISANTKYGALLLKRGEIKKFEDFKTEKITFRTFSPTKIKANIRKIYGKVQNYYFLILEVDDIRTSIAYSDLKEINKAIIKLMDEVGNDCSKMPEYLENKYISDDDFCIGYGVSKNVAGKYVSDWFIDFYNSIKHIPCWSNIKIDKVSIMLQEMQSQIEKLMEIDRQ